MSIYDTAEGARVLLTQQKKDHWNRWGPFLSERTWGTVREDYSANGDAWSYLPHDHARSRTYRWNEDGLAGICDRHQYLCLSSASFSGWRCALQLDHRQSVASAMIGAATT